MQTCSLRTLSLQSAYSAPGPPPLGRRLCRGSVNVNVCLCEDHTGKGTQTAKPTTNPTMNPTHTQTHNLTTDPQIRDSGKTRAGTKRERPQGRPPPTQFDPRV